MFTTNISSYLPAGCRTSTFAAWGCEACGWIMPNHLSASSDTPSYRSEGSGQQARVPEAATQDQSNIIVHAGNAEPSSVVQAVSCLPSARPQTKQGRPAQSVCTAKYSRPLNLQMSNPARITVLSADMNGGSLKRSPHYSVHRSKERQHRRCLSERSWVALVPRPL
jgi:hypothetical protein